MFRFIQNPFHSYLPRAAELLLSIAPQIRHASLEAAAVFQTSTPTRSRSPRQSLSFTDYSPIHTQVSTQIMSQIQQRVPARHRHAPPVQSQPQHILQKERNYEAQEYDLLMTAKACMMNREYARVEPLLHDCESAKARFLAAYSIFLVTEGVAKRYWDKLDSEPCSCSSYLPPIFPQTTDISQRYR